MQGTDRTLRPELGHGGKQHTRQISTPNHGVIDEPVSAPQVAVGGVDTLETGEAVYTDPQGETRSDKDREDTTPLETEVTLEGANLYAAVYEHEGPGESYKHELLGNTSSHAEVEVNVDHLDGYVFVKISTGPGTGHKSAHAALQLTAAQTLALGAELVRRGAANLA